MEIKLTPKDYENLADNAEELLPSKGKKIASKLRARANKLTKVDKSDYIEVKHLVKRKQNCGCKKTYRTSRRK